MIVLPRKEQFIINNFFELSFKNEAAQSSTDFKLFEQLNSTDQYYLAKIFNWDDDVTLLNWIIESDKCDKGTASLIFWSSEPDFYLTKSHSEIPNYEKDTFVLLKRIIEKFNQDKFKHSRLKFDPTDRVKTIDWNRVNSEWKIPEELKKPSNGYSVLSLGIIQNRISEWLRERKMVKRNKRKQKQKK